MKFLFTIIVFLSFGIICSTGEAATVNYSYDNAGRLTAVNYGKGKTITYSYDNNGNLVQRIAASKLNLQNTISVLQILAHIDPVLSVFAEDDINKDDRIGLEEGTYFLQKISETRK